MNGSYNNGLDDVIASLTSIGSEIAWMGTKGKVDALGWDSVSLYAGTSVVNHANFPEAVLQCYLNKINIGIAWSTPTTIDNAIAYNSRQTDYRKMIKFMTTELETYGSTPNCTVSQYRTWIKDNYTKIKNAGMLSFVYEGWNYNYDITVPYSDGFLLHAYRTSTQMNTVDDAYNYTRKRLYDSSSTDSTRQIVAIAKSIGKVVNLSLLTSCEASYGQTYYKTHNWDAEYLMYKDSFSRLATTDMKKYIALTGAFVFTSKQMKVSKP